MVDLANNGIPKVLEAGSRTRLGGQSRLAILLAVGLTAGSAVSVFGSGCRRTFSGQATQPNPLSIPGVSQRLSVPVLIVTGDKDIQYPEGQVIQQGMAWERDKPYPLKNIAQFMVVSRDRLRFHVQLEHKWLEYANVKNWSAYLVDDQGRKYKPQEVDTRTGTHTSKMWDYERRAVVKNSYGDITTINPLSGHHQRTALATFTLFRGKGDFVFYSRDIFTPTVKGLRLVLVHKATAFEFSWRFDEDAIEGIGREVMLPMLPMLPMPPMGVSKAPPLTANL